MHWKYSNSWCSVLLYPWTCPILLPSNYLWPLLPLISIVWELVISPELRKLTMFSIQPPHIFSPKQQWHFQGTHRDWFYNPYVPRDSWKNNRRKSILLAGMQRVWFLHQIESSEPTLKTEKFGFENVSFSLKSALIRTGYKGKKEKRRNLFKGKLFSDKG